MLHLLTVAIVFLVMITVLVAAHEYGHYLFARLCGMEVEEFAIGLGNPKWVWMRKRGTEYAFRLLPLGGFVRIKGMAPQEDGSETQVPNGFYSKSPLQRLMVLFAGPLFSVLAGLVVLVALFSLWGESMKTALLGQVMDGGAAAQAGLKAGDLILAVNGHPVSTWTDMSALIRPDPGSTKTLLVQRGGQEFTRNLVTHKSDNPVQLFSSKGVPTGVGYVGQIGVIPPMQLERVSFTTAMADSIEAPIALVEGLASIFQRPSNYSEMMGGPVSIVAVTSDATSSGAYYVFDLAGMLSISVGILNLLPFYPLDGGQMLEAFLELFRSGKRLSVNIQGFVRVLGVALVGMLVISVLWIDFSRLTKGELTGPKPPPPSGAVKK